MKYTIICVLLLPVLTVSKNLLNFNSNKINYFISDTNHPPPPPPVEDVAGMARYIVHYSEWCALSHISHQKNTSGFPLARVFSMSDGPISYSSGIPYIYTSFFDATPRDLKIDNRCSMTMSLAQGGYCNENNLDPEDPRCAQAILSGNFIFLKNNTEEWNTAREALFSRHPVMKTWPADHHFMFGKLDIKYIQLLDNFGGSKYPSVKDYFNAKPIEGIVKTLFVEMI